MAALCVVLLCSGVNVAEADVTVGGGNKADYTQKTQITGVNNTVTGTDGNIAKLNYVYGLKNTVTNAFNNVVMCNDHTVTANNTIEFWLLF